MSEHLGHGKYNHEESWNTLGDPPPAKGRPVVTDVTSCARCGGDHKVLRFEQLSRAVELDDGPSFTHWSPCPKNRQPILLRVCDDG